MGHAVGLALGWTTTRASAAAPTFVLEDQWERKVDQSAVFRSSTVVIVGGDQRSTGDRIAEWAAKLDGVLVYGIADLDGLPFFVPKSAIRDNLKTVAPKTSVLLDWKGSVYAPLLGMPKKQEIVAQVHDKDGRLIARAMGAASTDRVAAIRKAAGA